MHLNLHQRQYLPLFLAEILKRGALDLSVRDHLRFGDRVYLLT